jgi:RNA polymerase sigma-70 factor, ECF subfamily
MDDTRRLCVSPDHRQDLLDVIERLPLDQREVIVLCGILGYDYESAAAVLDAPVGTIRSRLHRARTNLSRQLGVSERSTA